MLDSELSVRFLGIFDSQEFIEVVRINTNNHLSAVNCAKWVHDYMTTSTDLGDLGHFVFMAIPKIDNFDLGIQSIGRHELCSIVMYKRRTKQLLAWAPSRHGYLKQKPAA